jgi:hypothetical protein
VNSKKSPREIRATDSPKQWAIWFLLFYPLAAPIYAYTRRNWSVLVNTLAFLFAVSIIWELAKSFIKGVWSYDIDTNSILDGVFTIFVWVGIALVAYYSIRSVVGIAKSETNCSNDQEFARPKPLDPDYLISHARNGHPRRSVQETIAFILDAFKPHKKISYALGVLLLLVISAYALYTATVEATIKSNPVLAAVAATGTEIRIKHFNCGDMYGFYDSGTDSLEICTAVHDDNLFSSKESTIRHEAWHLVQACSAVKTKNDAWGEFVEVNTPFLNGKTLNDEDLKYISENYDQQSQSIEKEAFLAEFNLTDGQIISAIEEKCYFPE